MTDEGIAAINKVLGKFKNLRELTLDFSGYICCVCF
jgi:hypothetical protein